jgi:multidrug efflux pump subunit AcrA (membrane-fusion protein)
VRRTRTCPEITWYPTAPDVGFSVRSPGAYVPTVCRWIRTRVQQLSILSLSDSKGKPMSRRFAFSGPTWQALAPALVVLVVVVAAGATHQVWLPRVRQLLAAQQLVRVDDRADDQSPGHEHAHDEHGDGLEHDDDHPGHTEAHALELSNVAWKNIGLTTGVVEPRTFVKTVSVPAMVVERPGRSQVEISTPLTGIVTRLYLIEGEAILPGQAVFDLRLTHEDLVTVQREFLQAAERLDVVDREISRLESVGQGVIAGRRVLEQQYERDKVGAELHAQRQGLLLHGLSERQIEEILSTRRLLPTLTVKAPPFDEDADHQDVEHLYHVQNIPVKRGQSVAAGETLAVLADHCLLYVEGQAFEDDAQRLTAAARADWPIEVAPVATGQTRDETLRLSIFYVADQVDRDSRALRFYLLLPNELVRDEASRGRRLVTWKYRPGQRMEVHIPVSEPWSDQIVLPPEAVVDQGAETFVFEQNGNHFDRVPVHVLYRGKDAIVVENDGTLVGKTLAMSGAYQMHLAIRNKAGGGPDPHAGHNH